MKWDKVLDRLMEETGASNPRELDELVDSPKNYSYLMGTRGMSKGYIERVIENYPNDVDWNYVLLGKRTGPKVGVEHFISQLIKDKELSDQLVNDYKSTISEFQDSVPRSDFYEEILQFVLRLLSAALASQNAVK